MEQIEELLSILKSIYTLFQNLYEWGGVALFISILSIYFFFRIFSTFFPPTPKMNLFLAFLTHTILWILWQKNYQGEISLSPIWKTYQILLIPIVALLLIRFLLERGISLLRKKRKLNQDILLFSTQKYAAFLEAMAQNNWKEARKILREIEEILPS